MDRGLPLPPPPPKGRKIAIALLVAGLVFGCILGYGLSSGENVSLKTQVEELESQVSTLKDEYNGLVDEYNTLLDEYNSLEDTYKSVRNEYQKIQLKYNNLEWRLKVLNALIIGHLLEDYYDELRSTITSSRWWQGQGMKVQVEFARDIAKHSLHRIYWPKLDEKYYDLAGEYSYETAYREFTEVYSLIPFPEDATEEEKIAAILEFITTFVHYESDYNNAFLAPEETLAFRSGDCDDFTILAAALFEQSGIDSAIGFFKSGYEYHAMVLVHLEDLPSYSYWYYSDLTGRGLKSGRWIIIEPQCTIDNQHDPSWFEQWDLLEVAEV
jgi:hypothetical protein